MAKCKVGDFVETIHGINGIVTDIKKCSYYGEVVFIATPDMGTFFCPIYDVKERENND
ncbi:MAG: hypothetical protein IJX24_03535 [Oscillospiraceae bacterium]|nr:hypothetical protein [Oscillospiraceae bacterium]